MILILCLFLAGSAYGQLRFTGSNRLRVSDTEKYFYNALDHRIEPGWSDARSSGVQSAYGVVSIPAQNLAQLNFSENGVWRVDAGQQGYLAKQEDQIVFRIRGDAAQTPLVFFAGPSEGVEPIRHEFIVTPEWHLVQVSMKDLTSPTEFRNVGIRSLASGRATVYVAYMYLRINPAAPPKKKIAA